MSGRWLDLLIGALEIVLAVTVLRHLWRFRRDFPWLIALTAFFLLRGADRIAIAFLDREPEAVGLLIDALLVGVLVLLLVSMERVVGGLELALDEAELRRREYHRALIDYRTLVRHRLANPITAIAGSARALKELGIRDERVRSELLDIIQTEAERLETTSLDPNGQLNPEERDLDPRPRVTPDERRHDDDCPDARDASAGRR